MTKQKKHRNQSSLMIGLAILSIGPTQADEATGQQNDVEVIEVQGVRQRLESKGQLADMIEKTELLSALELYNHQAATLSEAIDTAPGIRVNNECSMCGIKRVMINGLKGEHTTILVDGVPMHSVVSSYYGMDAISTAGIDRIEIARGSGASLIAPEAIGGTINIITTTPTENSVTADVSVGNNHYRNASVAATGITDDGKGGILVTAQSFFQDAYDGDHNGVTEAPEMDNQSLSVKFVYDVTAHDNIEMRYARFKSNIIGGPAGVSRDAAIASYAEGETAPGDFFANGNVSDTYTGQPWETTEAIDTTREEYTSRWLRELNDEWNMTLTGSYIEHGQDSFYEGFDYRNTDKIYFADARFSWYGRGDHLITFGADGHQEEMRSQSAELARLQAADPSITGDSFDYQTIGAYIQDTWNATPDLEVQLALRLDRITADFLDQTTTGDEISKTMISPRANIRYRHSDEWTSRLSAGVGYRAPLTFFESDHGILEDGFQIAVDDIEESRSYGYALSYDSDVLTSTWSAAYTEIDHLAWIETENVDRPTLVNYDKTVNATTLDWMATYTLTDGLSINGGLEYFQYSRGYKNTFSVAPIEKRATLGMDWDIGAWDLVANATWIGSRNLADYGYSDRYNTFVDSNGNGLVDDGELRDPKSTHAPSFVTVDLKVTYKLSDNWSLYSGVTNLFDYTQANDEESPLYWENAGGEAAYDVAHIWGPLRGRQVYAGIRATL